ncbi:MAG TPA: hypothetical protein VMB71_07820 [Acetobacteraceae bacterium]|nr:hypothetical protein [Acetobacteraceae bacterium]
MKRPDPRLGCGEAAEIRDAFAALLAAADKAWAAGDREAALEAIRALFDFIDEYGVAPASDWQNKPCDH